MLYRNRKRGLSDRIPGNASFWGGWTMGAGAMWLADALPPFYAVLLIMLAGAAAIAWHQYRKGL